MRLRNIRGSKETIAASDYVVQEPETHKGTWGQLFGNEQPVQIEVGMGKGRFIMDMARLHPDRNFVGIEMYDSVLLRAVQKREQLEEDLPNLYFIRMDARNLPDVFEKGEVDKIYLNFSDPWPKERHAKRRLTSRYRAEIYRRGYVERARESALQTLRQLTSALPGSPVIVEASTHSPR